jgi:hypothetical protein
MKTSVLMAGVAECSDIMLRSNDPGLVDFRKTQPAGQLERYCQVTGDIDAIHFVGHAAPVPLLLQFANFEQYFDKNSMDHYAAAASDPNTVLHYDTGHDLNDPKALEDRYDWLMKYIDLRREPIISSAPLANRSHCEAGCSTNRLMFLDFAKHRLDVDHRRAVDGFHLADSQALLADFAHGGLMKADRIGPIRGSRRKYTGQSPARVRARMHLQNLTLSLMQPGQDHDLVAYCKPVQGLGGERTHFKPGIRGNPPTPAWVPCSVP